MEHSKHVIKRCGGLPLAHQVLGSSLFGKSVDVWESALRKLEVIPHNQILKKLKISYDSLEDDHEKNLFLDIACFFFGKDRDYTVTILDGSGFYTTVGIQNLINRCLISIDDRNKLMMHQLLRDKGREVICQESPEEIGRRSRLWHHKDSFNVLDEKTGLEMIQDFVLDMHMFKQEKSSRTTFNDNGKRHYSEESSENSLKRLCVDLSRPLRNTASSSVTSKVDLKTYAFIGMQKLRLLELSYVQLTGGYKKFPKKLRWLCWHGFPLKSIPCDFPLDLLVALDMHNSRLEQIWKGTKPLKSLKILNLSHCHGLTRTPDFSGVPSLEKLILKDCIRLVGFHESIEKLERLLILNLRGCKNLRRLPREICKLKSLKEITLADCSKLDEFPEELGCMESLKVLNADDTAIYNRPPCTTVGINLWLSFFQFFRAWPVSKPRTSELASLPRFLVKLSLMDCNISDDALPRDLCGLQSLQRLYLGGNPLRSLPESIKGLTTLQSLQLDLCSSLQSLPELPPSIRWLNADDCTSLERITNLPNWLRSLRLDLVDCTELVEIQGLFRLEPIEKFDSRMMNCLCLVASKPLENIEVELCNNLTEAGKRGPIQGLSEFGIFSIFLPGSEVPRWFSENSLESSISFTVPSSLSPIGGLFVCVVYAPQNRDGGWDYDEKYLTISNETKGLNWTYYSPVCFGNPTADEYMVWLSHWKFGNQFECGDQVNVSIEIEDSFQVKECGVHLLDYKEVRSIESSSGEAEIQNVTCGDLSAFETSKGSFLLCHYKCMKQNYLSGGLDPYDKLETTDEEDDE